MGSGSIWLACYNQWFFAWGEPSVDYWVENRPLRLFFSSAASTAVARMAAGSPARRWLLSARSEWTGVAEFKTLAHQALRLLRRTSLGDGDIPSSQVVAVNLFEGRPGQLGGGHSDEGESARPLRGRIDH